MKQLLYLLQFWGLVWYRGKALYSSGMQPVSVADNSFPEGGCSSTLQRNWSSLERHSSAHLQRPRSARPEGLQGPLCRLAEVVRLCCWIGALGVQSERVSSEIGDVECVE